MGKLIKLDVLNLWAT